MSTPRTLSRLHLTPRANATIRHLEVTFYSSQTALDTCDKGAVAGVDHAISFTATQVQPSEPTWLCYNISDVFTGTENSTFNSYYLNYTVRGAENYDSSVSYSKVLYRQQWPQLDAQGGKDTVGYLSVQAYDEENCMKSNVSRPLWVWSCLQNDDDSEGCSTVPYDIQSFAIFFLQPEARDGSCYVGDHFANVASGSMKRRGAAAAIVAGLLCSILLVWLSI